MVSMVLYSLVCHTVVQFTVMRNLVNMNSMGPSKIFIIIRNFTLTVASCISVIMSGNFKVVHISR